MVQLLYSNILLCHTPWVQPLYLDIFSLVSPRGTRLTAGPRVPTLKHPWAGIKSEACRGAKRLTPLVQLLYLDIFALPATRPWYNCCT